MMTNALPALARERDFYLRERLWRRWFCILARLGLETRPRFGRIKDGAVRGEERDGTLSIRSRSAARTSYGLERGEKIKLSGFGNFVVREKKYRVSRNPQTGQEIEISARRVLTFRPSRGS